MDRVIECPLVLISRKPLWTIVTEIGYGSILLCVCYFAYMNNWSINYVFGVRCVFRMVVLSTKFKTIRCESYPTSSCPHLYVPQKLNHS